MAGDKTVPTGASVADFINQVEDERKQTDAWAIGNMMKDVTGEEPVMWGPSLVGFGKYRYRYKSGREGEFFWTGFSPRKQNLTLYIMDGFDNWEAYLAALGKHKTGKSCLYIK
ncbi:MAG: DUF1801 domain-containing protein, partial [Bacteroidota bacterium]